MSSSLIFPSTNLTVVATEEASPFGAKPFDATAAASSVEPTVSSTPAASTTTAAALVKKKKSPSTSAKGGKAKKQKLGASDVADRIEAYLLEKNRPYNASAIYENLHRIVTLKIIKEGLDACVERGSVSKTETKTPVFWATQKDTQMMDPVEMEQLHTKAKENETIAQDLALENAKIAESSLQVAETPANGKPLDSAVEVLRKETEKLRDALDQINASVAAFAAQRSDRPSETSPVDAGHLQFYARFWRNRRSAATDLLRDLCSLNGLTFDQVCELVNVEQDPVV